MITLCDGPAIGTYLVKRAPLYLRAVIDSSTGAKDVLNELDDDPTLTESIFVYKLEGEVHPVHLLLSPRSASGFYVMGKYNYLPDVNGELLRETAAWRSWVIAHTEGKVNPESGAIEQSLDRPA